MKKVFFILALPLFMAACSKSSSPSDCNFPAMTTVASAAEIANLKEYLDTNSLAYVQHPSGIFYHIVTPGSGTAPVLCSDVTVKYKGTLTNGTIFDNSNPTYPNGVTFTLGQLIGGWQIGLPLIQKGGSVILYIPPSLGYGARGSGAVPPNANLVFDIDLLNVQ